jgi:hypothetical protein
MPYGKHRGRSLGELADDGNRGYLEWLADTVGEGAGEGAKVIVASMMEVSR